MKEQCFCKQSSFEYYGKDNVLIGLDDLFEVNRIIVVGTLSEDELKQQREIAAKSASTNNEPINTDDIFNGIDWSAFGNVTETTQNKEVEINKAV